MTPPTRCALAARPLREWPASERPVARLAAAGAPALADTELLAVILGSSGTPNPAQVAEMLLTRFGSWLALQRASLDDLQQLPGVGPARAAQVVAALELARRLPRLVEGSQFHIRQPRDAAFFLQAEMGALDHEELRTVCLTTKNRVQTVHTVYVGSLNTSLVRVGEVFREAVRRNSAAILVVHNHPSQDPTPSSEDVQVTKQIVAAGQLFDIECLDHLIVTRDRFVSLRERGLGFDRP